MIIQNLSAQEERVKLDALPDKMPAEYEKLSNAEKYRIMKEEREANIEKDDIIDFLIKENESLKKEKLIKHSLGINAFGGVKYDRLYDRIGADCYIGINYRRIFNIKVFRFYIRPYFEAGVYAKIYDDYGAFFNLGGGFVY
ncbi:MAG: hypothetical protein JXB50_12200 [Spirochaetes bacterium]|nr:hypothetical protein [Spirochaetota bacterium]